MILLGHSQCGGIQTFLSQKEGEQNDFISNWVSLLPKAQRHFHDVDDYAKLALQNSHENCLSFPWIKKSVEGEKLLIHLWFFDIQSGQIFTYSPKKSYLHSSCFVKG